MPPPSRIRRWTNRWSRRCWSTTRSCPGGIPANHVPRMRHVSLEYSTTSQLSLEYSTTRRWSKRCWSATKSRPV
eukprot:9478102-Pyramimonas_sp.AAC.1